VAAPIFPHVLYRLSPQTPVALAQTIGQTPAAVPEAQVKPVNLPPVDPSLPKENYLVINSIGVNGLIHEGNDWEKILRQGIWKVPDFPEPSSGKPVILAAHRWGYLEWSNSFRRLNSFYNLPKVKTGDQIEVVWGQRKYLYEVYRGEQGDSISDYSADLILYTCQLWNSPIRVFRYAKRVN
jgi:sortase (surface protein transpeptidase)